MSQSLATGHAMLRVGTARQVLKWPAMRKDLLPVGLLVGALWMWSATQGKAADQGLYLNLGAGVNIINDVDEDAGSASAAFDTGFRLSVGGGYHFTPMISAEIESGYLFNEVEDAGDTALSQVPFLVNAVFRFENSTSFVPFIGAGVGGVATFLTIDDFISGSEDDDSDVVFAWQAQAGVHYRINENMSAGITYKYLGIDGPEFEFGGGTFGFEAMHNHSLMASFQWSF